MWTGDLPVMGLVGWSIKSLTLFIIQEIQDKFLIPMPIHKTGDTGYIPNSYAFEANETLHSTRPLRPLKLSAARGH